ncbi:MAG: hypothetical protein ACOC91_00375 [bacterium]
MTRPARHIIVLLQVLALVAYPQMVGAAGFSRAASAETISDAAQTHLDNDTENQPGHHHDPAAAEHHHELNSDGFPSGQNEGELAWCHPCCIGGNGPCIAVMAALPDVAKSDPIQSFTSSRLSFLYSLEIRPLPHPPKART